MDVFEVIAFIILLAGSLIFMALYFVLPGYIAYRRGKNWKSYILPSLLFGPLVIPFALYKGKNSVASNEFVSPKVDSNSGFAVTNEFSILEPGEVLTLKLSAKKVGKIATRNFLKNNEYYDGYIFRVEYHKLENCIK